MMKQIMQMNISWLRSQLAGGRQVGRGLPRNNSSFLATDKQNWDHGDVEHLVLHLHGISSRLQHSSAIISLPVIVYVPQRASSLAGVCHSPKT